MMRTEYVPPDEAGLSQQDPALNNSEDTYRRSRKSNVNELHDIEKSLHHLKNQLADSEALPHTTMSTLPRRKRDVNELLDLDQNRLPKTEALAPR